MKITKDHYELIKEAKSILLLFTFIFMKITCYSMFILTGAILIKQMPNPEPLQFLFNIFCAFGVDFGASLVDEEWKKSIIESYDNN